MTDNRCQKREITLGRRGWRSLVRVLGPVGTVITKKSVVKGQREKNK